MEMRGVTNPWQIPAGTLRILLNPKPSGKENKEVAEIWVRAAYSPASLSLFPLVTPTLSIEWEGVAIASRGQKEQRIKERGDECDLLASTIHSFICLHWYHTITTKGAFAAAYTRTPWAGEGELSTSGVSDDKMETHLLRIIFPPVYGTGGSSRIWGITSPPHDGHWSPKQAIDPGAQDHAEVSVGGHSSSCWEADTALVLFTMTGLTLVPRLTQSSAFSTEFLRVHKAYLWGFTFWQKSQPKTWMTTM